MLPWEKLSVQPGILVIASALKLAFGFTNADKNKMMGSLLCLRTAEFVPFCPNLDYVTSCCIIHYGML